MAWQLLLLISQEAEYHWLSLHLEMETIYQSSWLEAVEKVIFTFAIVECHHPWSSPECRNGNICWGKILAKNPTKKPSSSQHWMDYSLHWVLLVLLSFTEYFGLILDFWKSFLGNPTLLSVFWSGGKQADLTLQSIIWWRRAQLCSPKYTLF